MTNKLPNTITTDAQLDNYCMRNIPGYCGTISREDFARMFQHMNDGDSTIINLDPEYGRGGTHWVALRISSEAPIVYYKDSFGAPPPDDIVRVINSGRPLRGLIYGNRINQKISEENCGKRAAMFLKRMAAAASDRGEIEYFVSSET